MRNPISHALTAGVFRGYTAGMLFAVVLFSALSVLAAPARAAVGGADCLPLAGIGCFFVPEAAPADAPLLVYLRGPHPEHLANVPAGLWLESARQAFTAYKLGETAIENQVVVLVSYRSGLGLTNADLAALGRESTRTFSKTILASHSGGYVGLGRTLDSGVTAARIVMLDNFFSAGRDGLPQKLQRLISAGTGCVGFYTPRNKKNYEAGFKNAIQCSIDARAARRHNVTVGACLGGYLDGLLPMRPRGLSPQPSSRRPFMSPKI